MPDGSPIKALVKVRVGQPSDVDDVMKLALMGSAENGFVNPNPLKILEDVWCALNKDRGIVGIIGAPGSPEGAVLLRIWPLWYSDDQIIEERAIYVHPDHRAAAGGRATRLCEFSKMVSDQLGIPLLIGVLSNMRTDAKVRLYERHFGTQAGSFFLYGARTGGAAAASTDG